MPEAPSISRTYLVVKDELKLTALARNASQLPLPGVTASVEDGDGIFTVKIAGPSETKIVEAWGWLADSLREQRQTHASKRRRDPRLAEDRKTRKRRMAKTWPGPLDLGHGTRHYIVQGLNLSDTMLVGRVIEQLQRAASYLAAQDARIRLVTYLAPRYLGVAIQTSTAKMTNAVEGRTNGFLQKVTPGVTLECRTLAQIDQIGRHSWLPGVARRSILAELASAGPLTTRQLAERLGMSRDTAKVNVRCLLGEGLIVQVGISRASVHRPARIFALPDQGPRD